MKRLLLCLILSSCATLSAQVDAALAAQFQEVLDNRVSDYGDHGVSACVVLPGGEVWTGQSGYAGDLEEIEENTVFHAASITKMHVAVVMLQLAEEGMVNLDAPFQDYITLNASFNDAITVRQLLNHTSGIADYLETGDAGDYILADDTHLFTPQEIVEDIVSETPDFAPGTDFFYSNSNYVLAAMVIESVTQQTLAQQLRSRIWEPLEMTHSYLGAYEVYAEPVAGVWWNFGSGLQAYNSIGETSMLSFAYGCGNVVSTPSDLSIFIRAVFDGSLLSSGSFAEMTSFIPESEGAWSNGYGLGIHHASGDTQLFGHDGYYTNLTDMFHNPEIGYTVVTMTNTQTTWFQFFNQLNDVLTDYLSSTADIDLSGKCVVWPNPADEVVYFSALPALSADQLLVHDLCGRKISETNISSAGGIIELNVIGFPAGCYVATICGSNGKVQVQFVVE